MIFRVIVLPQAHRDINANAEWWAENHSVDQALRWSETVYDQIAKLETFPDRCPLSAENHELSFEIRDKLVGTGPRPSYRAVFTIRADEVYVLTVRRATQDVILRDQLDVPSN
jgi:plasmid stabilization system protein ParE